MHFEALNSALTEGIDRQIINLIQVMTTLEDKLPEVEGGKLTIFTPTFWASVISVFSTISYGLPSLADDNHETKKEREKQCAEVMFPYLSFLQEYLPLGYTSVFALYESNQEENADLFEQTNLELAKLIGRIVTRGLEEVCK